MIRIALFGQKENGKTTAAKIIRDKIFPNKNIQIHSFASPIYEELSRITHLPISFLRENKNNTIKWYNCSIRQMLQQLGEMGRKWNNNLWIDQFNSHQYINYIIDDGRHQNEVADGKFNNRVNILIIRPSHINNDEHESERWIGNIIKHYLYLRSEPFGDCDDYISKVGFNYVVINDGTIEDLANRLSDLLLTHNFEG